MMPDRSQDPLRTVDQPPPVDLVSTVNEAPTSPHSPESLPESLLGAPTIVGYRLTEEIARGGMGCVYGGYDLTLDREVAIKTLLPGANAERFVTEAKITARLPHPNIPPVHALGALPDGTPWLAMKRIHGQTLAALLKARSSPSAELSRFVQIFEQIAQAVGFAHQRAVIHRDLKPLNVMVGEFGEVQVMDWGLAKYLESRDRQTAESESHDRQGAESTHAGAILGTPGYMAPEQARGETVDTRADVFALGSILAAILTGKPAFVGSTISETIDRSASADLADVWTRLEGCSADAELIALARRCLAAKPQDRPRDARTVADEVAAYRAGVEARLRQAETERAQAQVREAEGRKRRRQLLGAAGAVTLTLALGLAGSLWQMNRAIKAEGEAKEETKAKGMALEQAERNLGFSRKNYGILAAVFEALDPKIRYESLSELRGALKSNLQRAVQELEGSSIGDPLAVAQMQNLLGVSLVGLGESELAIKILEKAHATQTTQLGKDHSDTLKTQGDLGVAYLGAGQWKRGLSLLEDTYTRTRRQWGIEHPDTLRSAIHLGTGHQMRGQPERAIPLYEEILGPNAPSDKVTRLDIVTCVANLGMAYLDVRQVEKAMPLIRVSLERRQAFLGEEHPDTVNSKNNLALGLLETGKVAEALALFEETLRLTQSRLGKDHPSTLLTMNNLALTYEKAGRPKEALALLRETLSLRTARLGSNHPDTLLSLSNLANALQHARQIERALPLQELTLRLRTAFLGEEHPATLATMGHLALCYVDAKEEQRAIQLLEKTVVCRRAYLGVDHESTLLSISNLAALYMRTGQAIRAIPLLEEEVRHLQARRPDDPDTVAALGSLGKAYCDARLGEKAAPTLRAFVEGRRKRLPPNDLRFLGMLLIVSTDLLQCEQFAAAEEMQRELLGTLERMKSQGVNIFLTRALLGASLLGQKKYSEAEPLLVEGYQGLAARERTIPPPLAIRIPETLDRLIALYEVLKKPDEVQKYRALRAKYPVSPPKN